MTARTKLIIALGLLAMFVAAAILLPVPSPAELRNLAESGGVAAPLLFLLAYSLLAVAPLPRTAFNLAAGLLLGNALGIGVAMVATTISATLSFWLARGLGAGLVARHLHRSSVRAVNNRLADGGVLAITSLRLIPVIPFAPFSYCCGLLAIKPWPYVLGTAIGSLPGTVAVVVLGDALTGGTPPVLLACYAVFAVAGAAGLFVVTRRTTTPQPAVTTGNLERNHP